MMWQCSKVVLVRRLVDNVKGRDLVRAAKEAESKRVSRLHNRKEAEGTNPYNKAQYISAFLEAHSVRLARERRLQESAAAEKSQLAVIDAARPVLLEKLQSEHKRLVALQTHSSHNAAFGSWREGHPSLERMCMSVDRNLHCIVRGAMTPPAFSPEALQRSTPIHLASMQALLKSFSRSTRGTWSQSRMREFTGRMDSCLGSVCGGDHAMAHRLLAVVLQQQAATTQSWRLALQLFHSHMLPYLKRQEGPPAEGMDVGISTLIAVLCESIRSHCRVRRGGNLAGPPFHTVVLLSNTSCDRLLPVAAAPLFSILHPSGSATWRDVVALAQRFHVRGEKRMYLPCVAWGEMLRAMRRMGATMGELQTVVDIITDSQRTKHGEKHMHDTNIWNAYLATSDWRHSLDLFSSNWRHYGVKETAATSAAIMESLLRDRQWTRALAVFHRLQKKEGQLIVSTCGVFVAVFQALGQKRDWRAVTSLLLDFDCFLAHFNVSHDYWLASPLREQVTSDVLLDDEGFRQWMAFARDLQSCSHMTCELVDAIQSALIACDPRVQQELHTLRDGIPEDHLTAEGLYDSFS